jgi:hypothetical protein
MFFHFAKANLFFKAQRLHSKIPGSIYCAIITPLWERLPAQPECLSAPRCDEASLIEIVERGLHPSASEWLFLRELRVGTGRHNGGAQRLDAFALNTLPHTAMKRVCSEVKTSRADFLAEIKRPLKRRIGMRYSNEFYFVTPATLVSVTEIPPECGLVEAGLRHSRNGKASSVAKPAFSITIPKAKPIV